MWAPKKILRNDAWVIPSFLVLQGDYSLWAEIHHPVWRSGHETLAFQRLLKKKKIFEALAGH